MPAQIPFRTHLQNTSLHQCPLPYSYLLFAISKRKYGIATDDSRVKRFSRLTPPILAIAPSAPVLLADPEDDRVAELSMKNAGGGGMDF